MATNPNENNGNGEGSEAVRAQGPQGRRLALNITPAFLNPEAGPRIAEAPRGSSEHCGLIWGTVDYGMTHPNHYNKEVTSTRWHGTFGFQKADGTIGGGSTIYIPAVVERQLQQLGAVVVPLGDQPPPRRFWANADFSVEIQCERFIPKPGGRAGNPYIYVVYDLQPPAHDINHLAPPEVRALLPAPPVERRMIAAYDPDTGEIEDPMLIDQVEIEAATEAPEIHPDSLADMRAAAARNAAE